MPIAQYTNPTGNRYSVSETPAFKNRSFTLSLCKGGYNPNTADGDSPEIIEKIMANPITGILNELPTINISTEWEIAGISKLTDAIKKFTENDMIKEFAQLGPNYVTPVVTDGYTQRFPKKSCLVSFSLSFRAYHKSIYNTTSYMDIIKILTYSIAPHKYKITDGVKVIAAGGDTAIKAGKELIRMIDELPNKDKMTADKFDDNGKLKPEVKESITKQFDNVANAVADFFDEFVKGFLNDSSTGGASRYRLEIKNYLKNPIMSDASKAFYYFIDNWSFKPSTETVFEDGRHYPAYCDFEIALSSDRYVDNELLRSLII